MNSFPLYDSLVKDIPEKDLSVKQKEEFMDKIKSIDDNGRDLIYALIQFYNITNNDEKSEGKLPYGGIREDVKKGKTNLTWNFTDLPQNLRHILYKFICLHIQSKKEEQVRPEFSSVT